jgi:hypothetical protein
MVCWLWRRVLWVLAVAGIALGAVVSGAGPGAIRWDVCARAFASGAQLLRVRRAAGSGGVTGGHEPGAGHFMSELHDGPGLAVGAGVRDTCGESRVHNENAASAVGLVP